MNNPISKFNIDSSLIVGKWKGVFFKINQYTGKIEENETFIEFKKDFTGQGNVIQNVYGDNASNDFKWFPFNDSIQIITNIQGNYSNIPLLLFNVDDEEMAFHYGGSCILKKDQ